jgi:pSer/pThr/pTyr-binding forkhead associated (FHA) protein
LWLRTRRGGPTAAPLVLRLAEGGFALQEPVEGADRPLGIGQWHEAGGWKLRITHAVPDETGSTLVDNANWAAPEIRVITPDGGRTKQLRCVLPTEEGSQLVVGRGGTGTDLIVEDEHVSRVHLRFFIDGGKRMVEDLKSRWGTKLNGKPLMGAAPIKHGDEIRIGKSTIQYVCYWEVMPSHGAPAAAEGVKAEPTSIEAPALAEKKEPRPEDLTTKPEPAKPESAKAEPAKPQAEKVEEKKPAPPDVTKAAAVPAKRSWLGLDVVGAVIIVILVVAGLLYLARLVFPHR